VCSYLAESLLVFFLCQTQGGRDAVDRRGRASYNVFVNDGGAQVEIPAEWKAGFEAAARRPLSLRWRYAFIRTYKPVLDDADYRSFDTTEDYRRWCEANLPEWLGYARV
jgi:hypothetical protein